MADGQNTAAVLNVIKSIAPILGGALGGPVGSGLSVAAVDFLANKLGVQEKTPEAVAKAVATTPAADILKLELEFKQHCIDNDLKLDLAQIELNKIEAEAGKNTEGWMALFVSGWRPFLGWIGGFGIGYQFLLRPLLNGIVSVFGGAPNHFTSLEMQDLIAIVVTMLGHSAMRSYDKKNRVAS